MNNGILLALCLLFTTPAYAGKWLDYGNGVINLDLHNQIAPQIGPRGAPKNLAGMPLKYCVDGDEMDANDESLDEHIDDGEEVTPMMAVWILVGNTDLPAVAMGCDEDDLRDAVEDTMDDITDFLDSDDGYLKLDL